MKCHRQIRITSIDDTAESTARYVESFASRASGWSVPLEKSRQYQQFVGGAACCLVSEDPILPRSALHFAQDKPNRIHLTNIVPLEKDQLSVDEYNALAHKCALDLRKSARKDAIRLAVSLSQDEVKLSDILGGTITTKLFHQFKSAYPLTGHPNDIRRLDTFTCAVSKFSRKPFDIQAFEQLLVEELHWPPQDAKRCMERVQIGLEVLAVNKRF